MMTFFHKSGLFESANDLPRCNTAFFTPLIGVKGNQVTFFTDSRSDLVEELGHALNVTP